MAATTLASVPPIPREEPPDPPAAAPAAVATSARPIPREEPSEDTAGLALAATASFSAGEAAASPVTSTSSVPPRPTRSSSPAAATVSAADIGAPSNMKTVTGMGPSANAARAAAELRAGFEPDFRSKKTIVGMPTVTPARAGESARPRPMGGRLGIIGVPVPVPTPQPANDDPVKPAQRNNSQRPVVAHQRTAMGLAIPGVAPLTPGVVKSNPPAPAPRSAITNAGGAFREAGYSFPSDRPHVPERASAAVQASRGGAGTSRSAAIAVTGGLILAVGASRVRAALAQPSAASRRGARRCQRHRSPAHHVHHLPRRKEPSFAPVGRSPKCPARRPTSSWPTRSALATISSKSINRPGSGRDERVGLVVKIGYRIRPDLSLIDSNHPALRVAIDGLSGAVVTVEGKCLVLGPTRQRHLRPRCDARVHRALR